MTTHALPRPKRPYWKRVTTVMKEWLRSPSQVASIIPSFPFLTEQIADRDCVRSARRIVDLGPGTGGTTESLLKHARLDCRVLALEKTAGFIELLQEIGDPRLMVTQEDVVGLERVLMMHDFESPDVIVSGIPFSSLDPEVAESTIGAIHRTLPSGGNFIAYQLRSHVTTYAEPVFGKPSVSFVLLNLPPLRVFTWTKSDEP